MDVQTFTPPAALGPFLDPVALGIVGGGTLLAMLLRTPLADLGRGFAALGVLLRRRYSADAELAQIAALGRIARRHGLIALDRSIIKDRDIAAAVAAAVDGATPAEIEALLRHAHVARIERHRAAADLWTGAAEAAPAMGMIGTLAGLVRMFTAMTDPAAIGGAMAIALLSTLYGAVLANLVAMPIAVRLRRRARDEAQERARLIEPLAAFATIDPPRAREIAA